MALRFNENIAYTGLQPNFERDSFVTIEAMKNYSENYLPNIFIATCEEDGNVYVFNKSNEKDPVTGKWRLLGGGGGSKIKQAISAAYKVGGVSEGDEIEAGTEIESVIKKILEGEKKEGIVSYYGVSAEKQTNLAGLTKVEEIPNFSFTIDASNEYVIIACPNSVDIQIFSNGFDYTTSFTKFVSSTYTFYYSEVKVTCSNFTYTVSYKN